MKKRVVMILMVLSIACTATACSSGEDRVMEWCEEAFYQTDDQGYQILEEIMTEEESLDGLLETGPVDVDQLPSILEPIPGYYPYVIRFYDQEGELARDLVPGFLVDGKRYTIQNAIKEDIITGVAAYTADGYPCKVSELAEVVDWETGAHRVTWSAVYVFYVKEGLDVEIVPYASEDLIMAGSLTSFTMYWGRAMQEKFGYGWTYQVCALAPEVGSGLAGTVGVIEDHMDWIQGPSATSGVVHYYCYLARENFETVEMGGW